MNYIYILKSKKDNKLYVGSTTNLRKRYWQHQNGKSSSTKGRGPFSLVYYEACMDEGDARAREKYLKSGRGKRFIKERLKRFLFRTG